MAAETFVSALIAFLFISSPFCSDAQESGFSVELIHRDSPKSPFYNPNETLSQRITKSVQRSATRAQRLGQKAHMDTVESEVFHFETEYLMNIALGTPPVNILGTADTGSDLIWTQCKPCNKCFKQAGPLFDPTKSKTYKDVSCSSRECQYLKVQTNPQENTLWPEGQRQSSCSKVGSLCQYSESYEDGRYTNGNLAVDTVTLRSTDGQRPMAFPTTIFGCGHNNGGTFDKQSTGIIGLGGGPLSLISQLKGSIDGKFSYCLVPISFNSKKSTKLNFGSRAIVSGNGVVSTRIIKGKQSTYYYLKMVAISVNNKKIPYSGSIAGASGGNILIDSGSVVTYFPANFYSALESAVAGAVVGKRVKDPSRSFNLCYQKLAGLRLPKITAHFDGADVELKDLNTFVEATHGVMCLAFAASHSSDGVIYGSVAQSNFLIGYDTAAGKLSFKPMDCTKA